jgi:hypothetical protein
VSGGWLVVGWWLVGGWWLVVGWWLVLNQVELGNKVNVVRLGLTWRSCSDFWDGPRIMIHSDYLLIIVIHFDYLSI